MSGVQGYPLDNRQRVQQLLCAEYRHLLHSQGGFSPFLSLSVSVSVSVLVSVSLLSLGRGTTSAEDAQGTPTQRHTSPSILGMKSRGTRWVIGSASNNSCAHNMANFSTSIFHGYIMNYHISSISYSIYILQCYMNSTISLELTLKGSIVRHRTRKSSTDICLRFGTSVYIPSISSSRD